MRYASGFALACSLLWASTGFAQTGLPAGQYGLGTGEHSEAARRYGSSQEFDQRHGTDLTPPSMIGYIYREAFGPDRYGQRGPAPTRGPRDPAVLRGQRGLPPADVYDDWNVGVTPSYERFNSRYGSNVAGQGTTTYYDEDVALPSGYVLPPSRYGAAYPPSQRVDGRFDLNRRATDFNIDRRESDFDADRRVNRSGTLDRSTSRPNGSQQFQSRNQTQQPDRTGQGRMNSTSRYTTGTFDRNDFSGQTQRTGPDSQRSNTQRTNGSR